MNRIIYSAGIIFLSILWLGNGTFSLAQKQSKKSSTSKNHQREDLSFQELANQVKPSIVVIESVDRIGREGEEVLGSWYQDGLIATNFHVIGEHRSFQVRFANGDSYQPTSIVAIDRARDLALFKIDAKDLPVLPLGKSDELSLGRQSCLLVTP